MAPYIYMQVSLECGRLCTLCTNPLLEFGRVIVVWAVEACLVDIAPIWASMGHQVISGFSDDPGDDTGVVKRRIRSMIKRMMMLVMIMMFEGLVLV